MPRQQILFPDGVTRTADENNYLLALYGGFDQNFRLQYSNTMLSSYTAFRNTYAQNYENYCSGVSETAKAHGYSSALEASLISDNVDSSLYEAVIKASLDSRNLTDDYAALIKNELGLDEIYDFDLNIPMAKDPGITYTYDEACELVLKALAPLGEKYVADARTALKGGWVDVYSADGKESGAYSMEVPGVHPYILLNFNGTFSDVSTLAHELGHTMNQWYSDEAQQSVKSSYPGTIVTEVTSTLNELLLDDYMIQNATTPDEKKYYFASEMGKLYTTFYRQAEFARFQQISMEALEDGEILTADKLDELWMDNMNLYQGDSIKNGDYASSGWERIPHFYMGFYVYQYSAAIAASSNIAQRIESGADGALDSYLVYIASGNPGTTAQTLAIAGVDATNSDFIYGLTDRFEQLIKEYKAL